MPRYLQSCFLISSFIFFVVHGFTDFGKKNVSFGFLIYSLQAFTNKSNFTSTSALATFLFESTGSINTSGVSKSRKSFVAS